MEKNWTEIFQVERLPESYSPLPTEPGECNANCQTAKELVCVCRCGGKNHGAALKQHVKPLDEFEDPVAETFNPEEYALELAVLA